jgi:DNA-damage-inducible protein D
MTKEQALVTFEDHRIRRLYDEEGETWFFSVIDVVSALTDSVNPRDYWFKMKTRVKAEDGLELSTICRQLKLKSSDGKKYATDCADVQGLLRIIQSIPSPKAEPFKQWLAKVGYERIQDMSLVGWSESHLSHHCYAQMQKKVGHVPPYQPRFVMRGCRRAIVASAPEK